MIDKKLKNLKAWGIISSICLPVGAVLVILSAINLNAWRFGWLGLACGIVLVVFGFYGTPILWSAFSEAKKSDAVCKMIREQHIDTVSLLASTLGVSNQNALALVRDCISKRYLPEYTVVENEYIVKLDVARRSIERDKAVLKGEAKVKKCKSCGSNLTFEGQKYIDCPYCGRRNFSN